MFSLPEHGCMSLEIQTGTCMFAALLARLAAAFSLSFVLFALFFYLHPETIQVREDLIVLLTAIKTKCVSFQITHLLDYFFLLENVLDIRVERRTAQNF